MSLLINNKSERYQRTMVWMVAALVFLNGLLAISRPLAERFPEKFEALIVPTNFEYLSRSLDIFVGVTLIYFSFQLLQRKKLAWWVAFLSSIIILISHSTVSHIPGVIILPGISFLVLLTTRNYFRANSDSTGFRQGVIVLLSSVVFAFIYGTSGFWLLHARDFGIDFSLHEAFIRTLREYLLLGNNDLVPHTRQARWFLDSLGYLGFLSLAYGLFSLFRPIKHQYATLPTERHTVETLLKQYSQSTEDFFKLWPHDKSYFFSSDRKAVIAYGVSGGMALTVGDPVGSPESLDKVLKEFKEHCLTKDWALSLVYTDKQNLEKYKKMGLNTIKIGEDAIVDVGNFATETSRNKHFRNIQNRFSKAGFTAQLHNPPHSLELLYEVALISREWLRQPDRKEWRFLAGSYSNAYMQYGALFVVRDSDGIAQAFVNLIPSYLDGQITIDLMRQRADAPANVMDYLFTSLLLALHENGYKKFNLGLAPLSGLENSDSGKMEERLLSLIYRVNQRFIAFQGLRRFKSKFEPQWQPKFIAYQGTPARLPKLALALAKLMRA